MVLHCQPFFDLFRSKTDPMLTQFGSPMTVGHPPLEIQAHLRPLVEALHEVFWPLSPPNRVQRLHRNNVSVAAFVKSCKAICPGILDYKQD